MSNERLDELMVVDVDGTFIKVPKRVIFDIISAIDYDIAKEMLIHEEYGDPSDVVDKIFNTVYHELRIAGRAC